VPVVLLGAGLEIDRLDVLLADEALVVDDDPALAEVV